MRSLLKIGFYNNRKANAGGRNSMTVTTKLTLLFESLE